MTATRTDLVLLHGWGMNSGVWDALPPGFAAGRVCHRIALPGHGGAEFSADARSLYDWADACLEQAPPRALWLGWSLGGLVALQAALQSAPRAPERIAGLILITTNPRFVQSTDWQAAMPVAIFDSFHGALIADPQGTLERFLSLQIRGGVDARETLRSLRAGIGERPMPRGDALAAGLELLREDDLRGRLADIHVPTLWLFGERDTLVPAAVSERIELLMPDARCETIAGAAHAPLLSHAAEAQAIIDAFLDEHDL